MKVRKWRRIYIQRSSRQGSRATTNNLMFRAIGFVIILWYVSQLFTQSFSSLDSALSESFETLEVAAVVSRKHIEWTNRKAK